MPQWIDTLDFNHYIKKALVSSLKEIMKNVNKVGDVEKTG